MYLLVKTDLLKKKDFLKTNLMNILKINLLKRMKNIYEQVMN